MPGEARSDPVPAAGARRCRTPTSIGAARHQRRPLCVPPALLDVSSMPCLRPADSSPGAATVALARSVRGERSRRAPRAHPWAAAPRARPASASPSWRRSPRRQSTRCSAMTSRGASRLGTAAPSGSSATARARSSGSRRPGAVPRPPSSRGRASCTTPSLAGDRVDHVETEVQRQDGMPVPVSLSVRPVVDGDARVVGGGRRSPRTSPSSAWRRRRLAEVEARRGRRGPGPRRALAVGHRHRRGAVERRAAPHPRRRPARVRRHARRAPCLRARRTTATGCAPTMEAAADSGRPFEEEYRIVRPDGEVRWLYAPRRADGQLGRAGGRPARHRPGRHRRAAGHSRPTRFLTRSTRSSRGDRRQRPSSASPVRSSRAASSRRVWAACDRRLRTRSLNSSDRRMACSASTIVVEVVAAGARPDHVADREGEQDAHQLATRGGRLATSVARSASTCSCTTTSG